MGSKKDSKEPEVVETKNPLLAMKKTPSNSPKPGKRLTEELFTEEQVSTLMQNIQARAHPHEPGKDGLRMPRTKSVSTGGSTLSKFAMKLINRKSLEGPIAPIDPALLRIASDPTSMDKRRSMDMTVTLRYDRTNSDSELPSFSESASVVKENGSLTISFNAENTASKAMQSPRRNSMSSFDFPGGSPPIWDDLVLCSSIVYNEKRAVTAATIDQLVFLLAGEVVPDKDFIAQVLRTHHRFVDSADFLQKLINRYNLTAPPHMPSDAFAKKRQIIQVRVINVIKKWIDLQISDFQDNKLLVVVLQKFIQALLKNGGTEALWGSNLQIAMLQSEEQQMNSATTNTAAEGPPPEPILPKNMIARFMQFLDVDPREMARQMTLIESQSLCKIQPKEYMHKCWCGSKKETAAPNVLEIIERFNKLSYWVGSEIVRQPDLQLRVKLVCKFIKLMKYLQELKNIQGLMAVYSALNMSSIQRLQETWKALPSKYSAMLKEADELMSNSGNYKTYREYVRHTLPPLVPFQGIYLSDLTFMEEAPDFLDNGTINFHKMGLVGGVFNEIHRFQTVKYVLTPVPCIQEYVTNFCYNNILDDAQLYNMSKTIEPRKEI